MRRGTREVCFSCLSHTPLSFFPITYRVFYLCLSCVLGYGWKRLDFDTSPGSKYQYYRAVFLDYEDIILDQKRAIELMTAVPDEVRQQALNLLDDSVPEAPPDSPPYSPSSPIYSPVCTSPIMEYPDMKSDTTGESPKSFTDDDNDEPLVE